MINDPDTIKLAKAVIRSSEEDRFQCNWFAYDLTRVFYIRLQDVGAYEIKIQYATKESFDVALQFTAIKKPILLEMLEYFLVKGSNSEGMYLSSIEYTEQDNDE